MNLRQLYSHKSEEWLEQNLVDLTDIDVEIEVLIDGVYGCKNGILHTTSTDDVFVTDLGEEYFLKE
jgi:hypothetical protein